MKPRFRAEWMVVREELLIFASCLLRPMSRNSMCRRHAAPTQAQVRLHRTAWRSDLSSVNYRGRAFPVAGAKVWNGLPSDVTSASSLSVFKNRLKTYLFRPCYETVWLWIKFLFPSHYLPSRTVVLAIVFHCLGHSKNVCDDDDDDDDALWLRTDLILLATISSTGMDSSSSCTRLMRPLRT